MGVLTTHGMGEGKPVRECDTCAVDTSGRTMKYIRDRQTGEGIWLCAPCFESLSRR